VFVWGIGKTFRVQQDFRQPDGTLVAKLANVGGLLNLQRRRLVADPLDGSAPSLPHPRSSGSEATASGQIAGYVCQFSRRSQQVTRKSTAATSPDVGRAFEGEAQPRPPGTGRVSVGLT